MKSRTIIQLISITMCFVSIIYSEMTGTMWMTVVYLALMAGIFLGGWLMARQR